MKFTLAREGNFYKGNLHTHTTVSDGKLTPAETVSAYKNAGYSFIAITDHNRWRSYPELSDDKFLLISGAELNTEFEGIQHVVAVAKPGCKFEANFDIPEKFRKNVHPQLMIDYINDNGCMAIYAHPFWSYSDPKFLASLKGLSGIEIANYSCEQSWKTGIAEVFYEYLMRDGSGIWCFGTDDAHNNIPDYFGGYITVKAASLTHEAITEAITNGSFYASYCPAGAKAPEIFDFYIEDGIAHLECSPCRTVFITSCRKHTMKHATDGNPVTTHSWKLPEGIKHVRCALTGFDGSISWGQPISY